MQKRSGAAALPDPAALRTFLEADRIPVSPPDILRAFGLPTHLKAALRTHLHAMAVAGDLALLPPGRLKGVTGLPETARAIITRMGRDGLPLAHLPDDPRGSMVALVTPHLDGNLLIPGDELILRLRPATGRTRREGRPIRLLSTASRQIAAVFQPARPAHEAHPPSEGKPDQLIPCDRRLTRPLDVMPDAASPRPAPGDVVLADLLPTQDGQPPQARIHASLGPATAPGMPATLSLLTHTIPTKFPAEVEEEACRVAQPPSRPESPAAPSAASAERRTDLRSLLLVSIDDATAEDFDDAIWAERTTDGFRLIIAIADVAHYVAPGSALDAEAKKRGNSVYLPGRVVPMLPPALSAGVCSLKPGEDRLCLFIELEITPTGQIRSGKLGRGIMRSAARLTYQAVQQELDNATPPDLILTLQAAALALQADAKARGVLSQPEEEYRVTLDEAGQPAEFSLRERQPAHDLVAAFMIAANRFAAEELMRHNAAGLFRVHPAPPASSSERTGGPRLSPRMQARYAASPGRHYGLALEHYAHFTSPIRRYADLVTHRALLATLERDARIAASLQPDRSDLPALAEHLQLTERRAASAVQTCQDRLAAIFLTPFIGHTLQAHVTAATRSGLAVTLTKTGTPSFLSFLALPDDSGMHDDSLPMRSDLSPGTRFLNSGLLPVVLTATHPAQGTLALAPAPLRHAS
ncbi:ribonuclease R [Acetobacter cerevisiae]|uniref:Ribonuclease R n=1 Tax=Acetobacter cerevisiae TaxID=178900 RepID=A0A149UYU8_9PROT|nr:ribonuclease R family protein [Acetobacter cerevisiae]KXV72903.1 hypothetical protein AD952_02075 [Acetobacter cerevisiae]MCP1245327.1 ribonuclease R [Acetobacter cerevisiae]MCP1254903.1 ribonuclease R [Acetobacter cerevisiae]